jgi:hypothetical protein
MDPSPPLPAAVAAERRAARLATPRLARELKTTAAMLAMYCAHHHQAAGSTLLCADCAELLAYARKRLAACPYGTEKPTCVNCPIHCYGRHPRERMRQVMRYAGPRMILRHPWLALAHMLDGRRPAPPKPTDSSRL